MPEIYDRFISDSRIKAFDLKHRETINFNISRYNDAIKHGLNQYSDLEKAKRFTANLKHKVINDLDKYLIEFEKNFLSRGGKVVWAQNKKEALKEILAILKKHEAKVIVKSKSMTTEEIGLNEFLKRHKIESIETDLGEYIVQVAGEKPYHIVTPAMHKSKEEIAKLFNKKFGISKESTPEEMTAFVRNLLREKFIGADAGITGANFLVADTGSVALTENEGNGMMSISFPRVHIVVAGIEKLIPSLEDLHILWPLLASHGTGQDISVYNSVISGPRQDDEKDGPEEMYVILLDNNRTEVLRQVKQRRALSCIRCGACLNACPVYKNIGGHSYGTTYSGPIGSVISPFMRGFNDFKHLSFASSLCGACTEICPVKINLHELLLYNRNETVKRKQTSAGDRFVMKNWKRVMKKRWMIDLGGSGAKNMALTLFFRKAWGKKRALPKIKEKSFRETWIEKRKI